MSSQPQMGHLSFQPTKAQETSLKRVWKGCKNRKMGRNAMECCLLYMCSTAVAHKLKNYDYLHKICIRSSQLKTQAWQRKVLLVPPSPAEELLPGDGCYKKQSHFSQRGYQWQVLHVPVMHHSY